MISDGIRAMFNLSSCSVKKFKHQTEHWFTFQPTWGTSPDFLCRRKIRRPAFCFTKQCVLCQASWGRTDSLQVSDRLTTQLWCLPTEQQRQRDDSAPFFYNNALHYNYWGGGDPGNVSVCTCTAVVLSSFWQEGSECSGVFWFCSLYHEYFGS